MTESKILLWTYFPDRIIKCNFARLIFANDSQTRDIRENFYLRKFLPTKYVITESTVSEVFFLCWKSFLNVRRRSCFSPSYFPILSKYFLQHLSEIYMYKFLGPNFNCPKFLVINVVVLCDKDFIYQNLQKGIKRLSKYFIHISKNFPIVSAFV